MANPKKTTKTETASQVATTPSTTPSTTSTPTTPAAQVETKKTTKKVEVASVEAAPVATPAVTTKATKKASSKADAPKAEAPKAEESKAEVSEPETPKEEEKSTRRDVTKQTVQEDFQALITKIQEEITKRSQPTTEAAEGDGASTSKKASKKTKETGVPVKFLRTINKRLATLQSDAMKMMKLKQKVVRNNENSGLMKPVSISSALYKFLKAAGFDDIVLDQNYARVDITRRIHSYVKDNNLRKESDKRVILPDAKLSELLNYDQATATEEMTYFRLPIYLKKHFIS